MKNYPLGIQLYSMKVSCHKNLEKTLAQISKIGYQGVEFHTDYGFSLSEIKHLLDKYQLKCWGYHIPLNHLNEENLNQTIAKQKLIDNQNIIIPTLVKMEPQNKITNHLKGCFPFIIPIYRKLKNFIKESDFQLAQRKLPLQKQFWVENASTLNEIADKINNHGLCLSYHNHEIEFFKIETSFPFEILYQHLSSKVNFQFDIGNILKTEYSPYEIFKLFHQKISSLHIKSINLDDDINSTGIETNQLKNILGTFLTKNLSNWAIIEFDTDNEQNEIILASRYFQKIQDLIYNIKNNS